MKKLFLVALAAVGMASCVQNEELAVAGSTTAIAFGDSFVYNATKADDPTTTTATIDNFDVWAFMDNVGGTVLTDEDVTKVNGAWGYQNLQYWAPNHTYYFAALSPANSANVTEDLAEGDAAKLGLGEITFTNVEGTEDLLYAKKSVDTPDTMAELAAQGMDAVEMQFQHLLSKVKFTFKNGFLTNNMKVVVTNVRMSAPESATINLAQANYATAWELGTGAIELDFDDVAAGAQLEAGTQASTDNYRLTIPASSAYEYTVTFDVVVYSGTVEAFKELNKQATIKGYELAMGKAYNFTAVINADSFGLQPIEFTAEVDEWSTEIPGNAEVVVGELVRDAQSLVNAIVNGGKNGVVTLGNDVALTEAIELPAGKKVTLDLGGNTIEGAFTKGGDGANAMVKNNGALTIVGGTIKNSTENGDAAIYNTGDLVLEGVKIEGAPLADGGYSAYAVISEGNLVIENGTVVSADRGCLKFSGAGETVINGGHFTNNDIGARNLTSHVVDVDDEGTHKLTINGGTFEHLHSATSGGVVICNRTRGTVYVNGGKFSGGNYYGNDNLSDYGYGGTFAVTGGVYTAKPAAKYIAEGYKAVEANGKYSVVAVDDVTAATSNELEAALADGGEVVLVDDVTYSASITNDAVINLNGNSFLPAGTINLKDNADLTMVGGDYVVNGTYGHVDVRPSTADGSVVVYENVNFAYNKLEKTYGPSTNRLGSVVEVCATATDAKTVIKFKNCTFDNAMVLFEGMSGKTGIVEAVFEGCTFNALTSSAPIQVQNYVTATIEVKNCTFNLECTSGVASAISLSSSSSTSVVLTATNNTLNAVAATPYTYDASKGETEAHNVKVNGTPANIKFISDYGTATVTETGTKKSGIAKL